MRRLSSVLFVALLLLPGLVSAQQAGVETVEEAEARRDYEVRIAGNRVLLDPVILWILDLPETGPPDEQTAERAERRLSRFFERTGYELARVRAFVQNDVLWVFVDEGVLEEIFVVGASTTRTANLRLQLDLPENVYNRIHVARELARIEEAHAPITLAAELVPVEAPDGSIAPIERFVAAVDTPDEEAVQAWHEQAPRFSLKVTATTEEWSRGFDFGVSLLGPYGLRTSASYSETDLLFEADRYSVSAEVGGLSETLFTSAEVELFYALPEQLDESLRPIIGVDGWLNSFERENLGLADYLHLDTSAVVAVGFEPAPDLVVTPGVGWGYDNVFGFSRTEATPAYIDNQQRDYLIGEIGLEWLIGREGFRRDKLHLLEAVYEWRTVSDGSWSRFEGDYQKAWSFGYDDLFLRSNFFSFLGSGVRWYDEDPITSQVMRAVGGEEEFARHLLALGGEYRLSIHDELVQAGLSASAAAAGLRDRQTRDLFFEYFAAGGPGLHIQLLDNFQLNLFYHWGWRANGETDGRFSLRFWKIY